jgi:hypothetical protein
VDLDHVEAGQAAVGNRTPLLRVLVDAGVASEEELRQAFAEGVGRGEPLGEVVLRREWLDEAGLARALAQQWDLPYLEDAVELDLEAAMKARVATWKVLRACPVRAQDGQPTVAVAEPSEERLSGVRAATGSEPRFAVVAAAALERLLAQVGGAAEARSDAAEAPRATAAEEAPAGGPLDWLEHGLEATAGQLVALRQRVAELVASEERREREMVAARAQAAKLREARLADAVRIQTLETELAERQQRAAAVAASLAEAARMLTR